MQGSELATSQVWAVRRQTLATLVSGRNLGFGVQGYPVMFTTNAQQGDLLTRKDSQRHVDFPEGPERFLGAGSGSTRVVKACGLAALAEYVSKQRPRNQSPKTWTRKIKL